MTQASSTSRSAPPQATDARQVWFNGKMLPADQAKVSVFDHGLLYGDGVFEGIRAYNGRVLKMRTHLRRLFDSARAIQLRMDFTLEQLAEAIHQTLSANRLSDAYIRLCVTRGTGTLGLNPNNCSEASTFIIADSIQLYPKEMYERGMPIVTAATIRNHPGALSPRIKSMNYLNNILAKMEAMQAGMVEALMLNHLGFVSECTGDNIFIVRRRSGDDEPILWTPPLHAGILEGITRNLVIDLAERAGMPVEQSDMTRHDVYTADECFLTGTAAEVIPVTAVDGRPVGDGKPGPVTARLLAAFQELVADAPED